MLKQACSPKAINFIVLLVLFLYRPMYVRQLARKKIKLETSSSIDTSSSLASSSSSTTSLVLTASSGGGSRSSLTTSPAVAKKSPARKDVGGGPVLTHTPVGSALRLAKGSLHYTEREIATDASVCVCSLSIKL